MKLIFKNGRWRRENGTFASKQEIAKFLKTTPDNVLSNRKKPLNQYKRTVKKVSKRKQKTMHKKPKKPVKKAVKKPVRKIKPEEKPEKPIKPKKQRKTETERGYYITVALFTCEVSDRIIQHYYASRGFIDIYTLQDFHDVDYPEHHVIQITDIEHKFIQL